MATTTQTPTQPRAQAQAQQAPGGFAVLCILAACLSIQLGAALAVQLFPYAGTWATSSVRLLVAAVILLVLTRPKFWLWNARQWRAVVVLGICLGLTNSFFYAGIERVPLGPAVTIEFLGPLLLAAALSRSTRDAASVGLALFGMLLLGVDSYTGESFDTLGVIYVLIAGVFWAGYILANKHAGALVPGQGGLAVALVIGGLSTLPLGWDRAGVLFTDLNLFLIAVGTGILASLIPYSLEMVALRSLRPQVFSILISLEPAFGALVGWIVLAQEPTALKIAAIGLVIAASVNQTLGGRRARKRQV